MAETLKNENNKIAALIGCESTEHCWFAFVKYVHDYQKKISKGQFILCKKIKEFDDNRPKQIDSKGTKTIAKPVVDGRYSIPYMPESTYSEMRGWYTIG